MEKSVGAENEAATVWPTSYWRSTTMPAIGETIFVYFRFVSDEFNAAVDCCTCAFAPS